MFSLTRVLARSTRNVSRLIEGRPPEAVLKPEPGAASAGGLQPPAGARGGCLPNAFGRPQNRVEKCRSGAPRGERPFAKDAETPRWLWRLDVPRKSTSGCPEGPKHPRVSRRSAPPRSPPIREEEGKRKQRLRRSRRRKTNGRRSYVLFDNLVGSARLSHGRSGESGRCAAHAEEHRAVGLGRLPACAL